MKWKKCFKDILIGALLTGTFFCVPVFAENKIRIVTTTSNLADFASVITGDAAEVYAVAPPGRDIHFIQPTPRDVLKVKKADVFIHDGLDLEAWRDPLLDAAGNMRLLGSGEASIDASRGIPLLEIPVSLSRSEGDIHLFGNPHFWTDPENAKTMAGNIAEGLARLYPDKAELFKTRARKLQSEIEAKLAEWSVRMKPYAGTQVVVFHNSWPYLARRFGLEIAGYIEPKPGIPPTAKHLRDLTARIKEKKAKLVIKEAYNESRPAEKVAREAGVPLVTLYQFAGQDKTNRYLEVMEKDILILEHALGGEKKS